MSESDLIVLFDQFAFKGTLKQVLKNLDPAFQRSFLAAQACHQRGDLVGAEAIYSRLLALDPGDDELLYLFGNLKASKGETAVGLECLRIAEQLKPSSAKIPYAIGVVLQQAGRPAESIAAYSRALELDPAFRMVWENLCAACYDIDDYSAGLVAAERALELDPESPLAIRGAANCLVAMGCRAEALAVLERGLKFHPAMPELRIHRAWELMANGRFAEGWQELEWKCSRRGKADAPPRSVPYPRWDGDPLAGKTILVYGEQGIGDEVMYAPFVLGLVRAGGTCILECEARLERAFSRAFPECAILHREDREQIPWRTTLPQIDFCVSALSLPLYFEHPLEGSAFLSADPKRTRYWRERLQTMGAGLKVGVSWRGGADAKARKIRSIPEKIFGEFLDANAIFVSLQYGVTADQALDVSPRLLCFPEVDPLIDLEEFLALVSALDAVVSIDNSTVHFAGALGVKTLMLLPVYSEWRWGNQPSGVSPWYQSLEFVRQQEATEQGWRELLKEARDWLRALSTKMQNLQLGQRLSAQERSAEIISMSARQGRSALLFGDTNYWYHWGCSCTSLGLHEGLRLQFEDISVFPLPRLLAGCPVPTGVESLDSDEFFERFGAARPDIVSAIAAADVLIINGEGSIHGAGPLPLQLLYIAYMAKKRLCKKVAVVNHSCYPEDIATDFYAKVYGVLDFVVVRERISLSNIAPFLSTAVLGFDCLPLFLKKHQRGLLVRQQKLVFGGSVSWSQEMVECFAELAEWGIGKGYGIEILSGAKAYLASDEIGFVGQMVRALDWRDVAHTLHFPLSEMAWLDAIGTASLVVSGRFHYSIAAAFQQVPFLVAESNTLKIAGMLSDFGLEPASVGLGREQYGLVIKKAERLLAGGDVGIVLPERLAELLERATLNFSSL